MSKASVWGLNRWTSGGSSLLEITRMRGSTGSDPVRAWTGAWHRHTCTSPAQPCSRPPPCLVVTRIGMRGSVSRVPLDAGVGEILHQLTETGQTEAQRKRRQQDEQRTKGHRVPSLAKASRARNTRPTPRRESPRLAVPAQRQLRQVAPSPRRLDEQHLGSRHDQVHATAGIAGTGLPAVGSGAHALLAAQWRAAIGIGSASVALLHAGHAGFALAVEAIAALHLSGTATKLALAVAAALAAALVTLQTRATLRVAAAVRQVKAAPGATRKPAAGVGLAAQTIATVAAFAAALALRVAARRRAASAFALAGAAIPIAIASPAFSATRDDARRPAASHARAALVVTGATASKRRTLADPGAKPRAAFGIADALDAICQAGAIGHVRIRTATCHDGKGKQCEHTDETALGSRPRSVTTQPEGIDHLTFQARRVSPAPIRCGQMTRPDATAAPARLQCRQLSGARHQGSAQPAPPATRPRTRPLETVSSRATNGDRRRHRIRCRSRGRWHRGS